MTNIKRLIATRQHLMTNIQLAESKGLGLLHVKPNSDKIKELYMELVTPHMSVSSIESLESYDPFEDTNDDDLEHECVVLKMIVERKYRVIEEMLQCIRG